MRVLVIGVGTHRGDDAAGLEVAEALARDALPQGVRVRTCERPGPELALELGEAEAVVFVDAVEADGAPGAVQWLSPEALARSPGLSSHGFGVAEVLALAEALGREPSHLAIVGIRRGPAREGALSPAVRHGVARARQAVRSLAARLAAAPDAAHAARVLAVPRFSDGDTSPCTKPASVSR